MSSSNIEWLHQSVSNGIMPLCVVRDTLTFRTLFDDEVFVTEIVRRCPILFRLASPRLRDIHELSILAVRGLLENISIVGERLRGTGEFIAEAYSINYKTFKYACEPVLSDVIFWEHVRGEGRITPYEDDDGNIDPPPPKPILPNFEKVRYIEALRADILLLDTGMTIMLQTKEFADLVVKQCPRLYHVLPEDIKNSYIILPSIQGAWS